ncbi:UNVERIFIED_CONTAM: hypothetical protein RMT77_012788 [Armadillidium vulgare]
MEYKSETNSWKSYWEVPFKYSETFVSVNVPNPKKPKTYQVINISSNSEKDDVLHEQKNPKDTKVFNVNTIVVFAILAVLAVLALIASLVFLPFFLVLAVLVAIAMLFQVLCCCC